MYTLYGAKVSYFSGKARAYLNWKGVPYREVGATKDIYTDIILPKVGWPVIPVVAGPGDEILQDTSDIIDTLEARHGAPSVYPDGP
ncbi:MAG: glutathione S-transferase N-terminal domain-containing protein, partial [Pseudomonadota bacterium]